MSTSTSPTKSRTTGAPAPVEADPMAEELAAMRQKVETQEAAIARLQELFSQAVLWADCPCGTDYRAATQLTNAGIRNGRLWHDLGHYSYFGIGAGQ